MASVADIRRVMSKIRGAFSNQTPDAPLNITAPINGEPMSKLAFEYVRLHHQRRHLHKGTTKRGPSDSTSDHGLPGTAA